MASRWSLRYFIKFKIFLLILLIYKNLKVDLGPMPVVSRGAPVDKNSFEYDKDGRILNEESLKQQIFKGV